MRLFGLRWCVQQGSARLDRCLEQKISHSDAVAGSRSRLLGSVKCEEERVFCTDFLTGLQHCSTVQYKSIITVEETVACVRLQGCIQASTGHDYPAANVSGASQTSLTVWYRHECRPCQGLMQQPTLLVAGNRHGCCRWCRRGSGGACTKVECGTSNQ